MSGKKMRREQMEMEQVRALEEAVERKRRNAAGGAQTEGPQGEVSDGRGVLPFIVQPVADGSDATGRAGLPLVVEVLTAFGVDKMIEEHLQIKERRRGFSELELVESVVLLQAGGGERMDDIEVLRQDGGLRRLLGRSVPSADAVGDFLHRFHDEEMVASIAAAEKAAEKKEEKSYIPEENAALRGLAAVTTGFARTAADPTRSRAATLDHDATVIDSHKEEAKAHYKHGRGYQPVAVVWAEQDLVLVDQFRDGNVPAGKENLPTIERGFEVLPDWVDLFGFRADTACYEQKILEWLADTERAGRTYGHKIGFTISADMTQELRKECRKVLEPDAPGNPDRPRWQMLDDTRADETVEWAEVEFNPGDWPKQAKPLRYLGLRLLRRQGKLYADGAVARYLAVVTNKEEPGDELIRWHWKKAGTIEHVHDDTKNGYGAGTMPCGKFGSNAAWYRLSMLTYNVTSVLRRRALPPEFHNAKPKRLRFLVFNVLATLTTHGRYLTARIADWVVQRCGLLAARSFLRQLVRRPQRHQLPVPAG
ncbi:MAG: IS1380 family transposase [Proteobacteria bacterium]|nr:IS1380 family transposase [Pseudomonadota bacterium]